MEEQGIGGEFFASSRPAFLHAGGLTPAQRGTVLHRFMQYADYSAAAEDVQKELDRLKRADVVHKNFSSRLEQSANERDAAQKKLSDARRKYNDSFEKNSFRTRP